MAIRADWFVRGVCLGDSKSVGSERTFMLTAIIWRAGILLEAIVLYRGFRSRLFSKYPLFYLYIASVLLADSSLYVVRLMNPSVYPKWNVAMALLSLMLGYGIVLEIFRHVLTPYPGVEKLATFGGLIIAGIIVTFSTIYPLVAPAASGAFSIVQLERDFWAVQAVFLFGILALISHYGISIGRNLKGMIFGYCLCLATTLMALALRSYIGTSFRATRNFVETFSYLASLSIWVIALWSDYPSPVAKPSSPLEADYESLVLRTRSMVGVMRSYLTKTVRP